MVENQTKPQKLGAKPLTVKISTRSLLPGNTYRGIGVYTRLLKSALSKIPSLQIVDANQKAKITHYPYFDFFFSTLPFHFFSKAVVTIHDTIPLIFPQKYKPGTRGALRFIRQKLALKMVKVVITDSESSKHDIQTYLEVPEKKLFVVPLAADERFMPQSPEFVRKIKRQYKLPKEYILYVGDINYNKNLPTLIKVMKYLPNRIKLVCVGRSFKPAPISEWRAIETQLALSGVENRVKFVTDIGADETQIMAAVYSGARVYVQPSLYEGFGLPVLEAMQSGTLVVASRTSSLPEVMGETGFQTEPTVDGLREAIEEALNLSQNKTEIMVRAGRKRAKEFSWDKVAAATAKVYAEI